MKNGVKMERMISLFGTGKVKEGLILPPKLNGSDEFGRKWRITNIE